MSKQRVAAFIDGFNLYHAIDRYRQGEPAPPPIPHHWKWLNLYQLCREFAPTGAYSLVEVNYFSAIAKWRGNDSKNRHRDYIKALESEGVKVHLGRFKKKDRFCRLCRGLSVGHEEKETDVAIGISVLMGAYHDNYDLALLLTQDSDQVPTVATLLRDFPKKSVRILTPIGMNPSNELVTAAGGASSKAATMKPLHLDRSLFPEDITDQAGHVLVSRPAKYDPPTP